MIMTYQEHIQRITPISFDNIIKLNKDLAPKYWNNPELYKSLDHGTAVLSEEDQLLAYLANYGEMHKKKIYEVLPNIDINEYKNREVQIIDWGCGQGLATMCLLDYFKENGLDIDFVRKVVLIEPSSMALRRARLHVEAYFEQPNRVCSVNKYIDDITVEDFSSEQPVTIHLFSNILDIPTIDLLQLANKIKTNIIGQHLFLCMGPVNSGNSRIDAFWGYFDEAKELYHGVHLKQKYNTQGQLVETYSYTAKNLVFKIDGDTCRLIFVDYYLPRQFHASFQLDAVGTALNDNIDKWKLKAVQRMLSDFEIQAPFDIGASVYEDVLPILAVLNNIVVRGLPTKASPFLEVAFSKFGNKRAKDNLGSIQYCIDNLNYEDLFSAMHLIDSRWIIDADSYNCDSLDSDLEKTFITKSASPVLKQILNPQRDLSTITGRSWHHSQRVDFSVEFPYCASDNSGSEQLGCVIELDGEKYHSGIPQVLTDQQRVAELAASKWKCVRLGENDIKKKESDFDYFGSEYVKRIVENYGRQFDESWKKTLQLVLTPIAVSRLEKTVLEALMTSRLKLSDKWNVLVIERDVPCAALAFEDLKRTFNKLARLSEDYKGMSFPEVNLTIISTKEFVSSPLHLGGKVYEDEYHSRSEYDVVIDCAMLRRAGLEKLNFSEYKCKNDCYFIIRSSHYHRNERLIYTSDKIKYKPLVTTDEQGRYSDIKANVQSLRYFLRLLFRKIDFRPGQTPILSRAIQNKSVIGLLPTGGGKSLTYQIAAMLQPGVTLVIDPLRSLMKDQYDGLIKAGIDCCTYINSAIEAPAQMVNKMEIDRWRTEERERRARQMEQSELLYVFLSPERLAIKNFRDRLKNMHDTGVYFSYGVIDEVHCVSEWGHDFRFTYLHLGRNLYQYVLPKQIEGEDGHIPLFGLTATASFDVLADVERELSGNGAFPLDSETIVRNGNTNRFELQYKIEPIPIVFKNRGTDGSVRLDKWAIYDAKKEALDDLISKNTYYLRELVSPDAIRKIRGGYLDGPRYDKDVESISLDVEVPSEILKERIVYDYGGIVFCPHRKGTGISVDENEDILRRLHPDAPIGTFVGSSNNDDAPNTTDGIDEDKISFENLNLFRDNKIPLMIATKAFGMGIDKPNVRFTINMNYSSSLESFVQEAGRAGRDRKMALATIMFSKYKLARVKSDSSFYSKEKDKWYDGDDIEGLSRKRGIPVTEFEICDETTDLVKLKCKRWNNSCKRFENNCCASSCTACEKYKSKEWKSKCATACEYIKDCELAKIPSRDRWKKYEHLRVLKERYPFLTFEDYEYLNADYETVLFFYNQNFKGELVEKHYMYQLLSKKQMEVCVGENDDESMGRTIFGFLETLTSVPIGEYVVSYIRYSSSEYVDIAKAIYRMCCIELIDDFTQDYNTKQFRIVAKKKADGEYYKALERFLMRYYSEERAHELIEEVPEYRGENEIHKCLGFLTHFIYDKIAVKRKRAIDDIHAFCILGANENDDWKDVNERLKDELFFYFNSKYARRGYTTDSGLEYSLTDDTDEGKVSSSETLFKYMSVADNEWIAKHSETGSTQIDNVKHLYGAVRLIRRQLTDDNPAIYLLGAFCLMFLGTNKNEALEEELFNMYMEGMVGFYQRCPEGTFWNEVYERFNKSQYVKAYFRSNGSLIKSAAILEIHKNELTKIKKKYTA